MSDNSSCEPEALVFYNTSFGFEAALPQWEALLTIFILTLITIMTIVGNILVILSVFTHRPLRIVQNFFIVSLAVADLTVAILVMPLSVAYFIIGKWLFGMHICKMWLTYDVMCCTASILNLCAIALDRFWAITDPINYAQKRTLKRVLLLIGGVWLLSLIISSPPLIGWNDWPDKEEDFLNEPCQLTQRQGYIIYSSLGSFYIPLLIMTIVYIEIFIATRRRLRERARASKINAIATRTQESLQSDKDLIKVNRDRESVSSETNHNEHPSPSNSTANGKPKEKKRKNKKKRKLEKENNAYLKPVLIHEDSFTDNPIENSPSSTRHSSNPNNGENLAITLTTNSTTPTHTNKPQSRNPDQKVVINEPAPAAKKSGGVYQFIEEKQRISLSKERRAARTLGIIMGVFVVCWLPFFLMYVIIPFCEICCPSRRVITYITWLGYVNSALNPIIYTIFNLDFRKAFKKLLLMQAKC